MQLQAQDRCDFTRNDAKQRQRVLNLERVKPAASLWSRHRQALRLDWLELAGVQAPTLSFLRASGALGLGARFIGVDESQDVLGGCQELHGTEQALWLHRDLKSLIGGNDECLGRVGVLNYDSFDAPCSRTTEHLRMLHRFALRQAGRFGQFLLIANLTHATAEDRDQACAKHHRALEKVLGDSGARWPDPAECAYVSKTKTMWNVPVRYGY